MEVERLGVLMAMMEVVGALEVAVAVGAVVVLQVQRLYGCSLACSSQLPCSWSRHLTHVIGRWWCWILTFNKEGGANGQSTRQCQYTYYTWKRNSPSLLDLQSSNTCHAPVGMSSPINIRKLLSTCLDVSVLQQFLGPKITRNRPKTSGATPTVCLANLSAAEETFVNKTWQHLYLKLPLAATKVKSKRPCSQLQEC